jgi:phospholipid/cholesterol/gamma-HCH transport system substrate-binding protein
MEWKVGLFVLIGLGLLAGLLLRFTKGVSFTSKTYEIRMRTANVGGLKQKAGVLMAGVPIGWVRGAKLGDDGKSVTVFLTIEEPYRIHGDAIFTIEAAGFLGDQFVQITPDKNQKQFLTPGAEVLCREPFNLQEAARSALGLIQRLDRTVEDIHKAVQRVDRTVLGDESMTNLITAFANVRQVSEQARAVVEKAITATDRAASFVDKAASAVERLDGLVQTNAAPMTAAVTNLLTFSREMTDVSKDLKGLIETNRAEINSVIRNFGTSTQVLTNLLSDLQAGKGLAGGLLKDEQFKNEVLLLVTNYNNVASNLSVTFSNLNNHGLWWMLWKPKAEKTNVAGRSAAPAKKN